jgi:CheY-like chemotaxis protein
LVGIPEKIEELGAARGPDVNTILSAGAATDSTRRAAIPAGRFPPPAGRDSRFPQRHTTFDRGTRGAAAGTVMAQSLRVLVVDDHPDCADATAQLLTLHGHDARPAHSCAEARAEVSRAGFVPDVVILDVRLPDGDGYALAGELCRALPARPLLIALTGLQDQEERCRAAGFDHYLLKPADPVALAALLASHKS